MQVDIKILGLPQLRAALLGLPLKLQKRALRNALAAGARTARDAARAAAPVLSPSAYAVRKGYRASGTLRRAISVRTSKRDRRGGNVGVFVNVRPAAKGQRGAKSPADPFYWRWVNFGANTGAFRATAAGRKARAAAARKSKAYRFLEAGAARLGAVLEVFKVKIGPALQKIAKGQTP